MITIVNRYTGEVVCKYSNASKCFADKDSFIANVKGGNAFRNRFNAVVEYYVPLRNAVQCLLREPFAILEKLTEQEKCYW